MEIESLNNFLRNVKSRSSGIYLRVDFSKGNIQHYISGFFNNNGIMDMLEATDIENVDFVPFFVARNVNCFCSIDCASMAFTFNPYVEIQTNISLLNQIKEWTDEKVLHLQ